ncbi:MAG: U32 family peptidase, partial [Ferrovum sp.]|nr:U32 family peptidase [Ferrovum sp.]
KIEGRQRGPAYVSKVTRVWREALDALGQQKFEVRKEWQEALAHVAEGHQTTLGPYHRPWH